MKPLSDADIMKGLKNVNKQLLGIVRLNSYDAKYTFSWKLISCKFIDAVSDAEICIWLFSFLKAKSEADWQFQGCLWMKLTTLLLPICRNKCCCRHKSVSRINSKWITWWIECWRQRLNTLWRRWYFILHCCQKGITQVKIRILTYTMWLTIFQT